MVVDKLRDVRATSTVDKEKEDDNNSLDPNFDRKLDLITEGAQPHLREHLLTKITRENCQTIVNYILAMQTELSPARH